jgi:hypothetical protein
LSKFKPVKMKNCIQNLTSVTLLVILTSSAILHGQASAVTAIPSATPQKKTLAEIWYKTGGHFENGKYTGGSEFKKFSSLRVPDECTDHSYFIKYEGPGWESDRVGYRLYLDWRNAIDVYGKKVDTLVLPFVGQDGYDSYHEMANWGMDILKVGESLGIGSLGFWDGQKARRVATTDSVYCTIAEDGDNRSEVQIDYYGWKIDSFTTDLKTSLSIEAGSRATRYTVGINQSMQNLCTGIVKMDGTTLLKGEGSGKWNYLATWGKQSLAGDSLGLAVLYRTIQMIDITEDNYSHVVILNPSDQHLEYYFLAAWEQELQGIKTLSEFKKYLNEQLAYLNSLEE